MKDKIKENKKGLSLALIVLLLLMVSIVPIKNGIQKLTGFKEKELKSIVKMDLSWEDEILAKPYEDMVLVKNKEDIRSYGHDNKEIWSKKINEQEEVYLGKSGFFINNEANKAITRFNLEGVDTWSYEIKNPAYTLTEIGDHLFIYSKVDESTRGVTVLDKDGKLVLDKEKSKEEILSANISKDKKKFVITSIDTSTPELKSKITYLKDTGETIWTEEVKDKIIYNILFTDDKNMLLIGDKEIICKNDEGKTLWEKQIKYNLKDIEIIDGNKIYILYGLDDSYLEVINTEGDLDYKKSFKKQYNHIEELDKDVILMGSDGLIGLQNEKITMRKDLKDIRQIEKLNDEILIFTDKRLEIFKILEK